MFQGGNVADEDYTVKLNIGEYSPLLGMSYTQFALEGLSHQTSQGTGGIRVPPGPRYTYYKLTDSTLPKPAGHEQIFLTALILHWSALRRGWVRKKQKFLSCGRRWNLCRSILMRQTRRFRSQDPSACAPPLIGGRD